MRLRILLPLAYLSCLCLLTGCAEETQSAQSDMQAMRSVPSFGTGVPQAEALYWRDLSLVVETGLPIACPTGCADSYIWEEYPSILEAGITAHLGSNLTYLRGAPTIQQVSVGLDDLCADLGRGERSLVDRPVEFAELSALVNEGVRTLDLSVPGGLRDKPVLFWAEFEPVMIEGLDWLTTQ